MLKSQRSIRRLFCSRPVNNGKRIIMSGIQPTGRLHVGNYLGAVAQWLRLQDKCDLAYLMLADLHALTTYQRPDKLRDDVLEMAATLIACGLPGPKCVLFKQSCVAQHGEMYWLLGCFVTLSQLQHLSHYREKAAVYKQGDVPLPLLSYPVLQAADILLYSPNEVPVGEDQTQHLRLTQKLARTINNRFGQVFPVPRQVMASWPRVRSLRNPEKKMSKSDADGKACLFVDDSDDVILEKIKKAVTDTISEVTYDPERRPGVANLIHLYCAVSGSRPEDVVLQYAGQTTHQFKLALAEVLIALVRPIRLRLRQLLEEPEAIQATLHKGAEAARVQAEFTLCKFKQIIGL